MYDNTDGIMDFGNCEKKREMANESNINMNLIHLSEGVLIRNQDVHCAGQVDIYIMEKTLI